MTISARSRADSALTLTLEGPEGSLRLRDGRKLGFMEFGDPRGTPVFAFHGTPGSRFMFRLADRPAREHGIRIIAPERPGFGLSTFQANRRLEDWPKDVAALAAALEIERYGVAGISGGGPYAVACAALLTEHVEVCALISPMGPVQSDEDAVPIGTAKHVAFRLLPQFGPLMKGLASVGRMMFLNAPDQTYELIKRRAGPGDAAVLDRRDVRKNLLEGVGEGFRPGTRGAIEEMKIFSAPWNIPWDAIKAPTFLWQGLDDRNVPIAASLRLAELIPGCQLFAIEGAGHYWVFDNMDEIFSRLRGALG